VPSYVQYSEQTLEYLINSYSYFETAAQGCNASLMSLAAVNTVCNAYFILSFWLFVLFASVSFVNTTTYVSVSVSTAGWTVLQLTTL